MTAISAPPLVLLAELVGVLALAAGAAALHLDASSAGPAPSAGGRPAELWRGLLSSQRRMAEDLGLGIRQWLLLRLGAGLAGALAGALSGIGSVALAGALCGLAGLPWLLSGRAARRRLQMERALAGLALSVRNLMQHSNLALDRALREAARTSAPQLAHALTPLAGDVSVPEALVQVARRARSPLADLLVASLLVARTHNPLALVRVTDEVLLPLLREAVTVQEENHTTLAQQRAAAVAIGVIMMVLFAAVVRVPTLHSFYAGGPGQMVLLAVLGMYLGLVWALGRIARPLRWAGWDLEAVRREAEALVG